MRAVAEWTRFKDSTLEGVYGVKLRCGPVDGQIMTGCATMSLTAALSHEADKISGRAGPAIEPAGSIAVFLVGEDARVTASILRLRNIIGNYIDRSGPCGHLSE